jgi:hypothetical protein
MMLIYVIVEITWLIRSSLRRSHTVWIVIWFIWCSWFGNRISLVFLKLWDRSRFTITIATTGTTTNTVLTLWTIQCLHWAIRNHYRSSYWLLVLLRCVLTQYSFLHHRYIRGINTFSTFNTFSKVSFLIWVWSLSILFDWSHTIQWGHSNRALILFHYQFLWLLQLLLILIKHLWLI